ncbi:MAG TPA: GNAT family N-acetyltransferase [Armatimonadota bacterium]
MITIRRMTLADIPFGLRLKTEANWNQVEGDWQRFLAMEPEGCFVAEWEGEPVGTLAVCVLGPVAWIGMVLVSGTMRGKGLGTALMRQALDFTDGRGIPTTRLDATPMGQPIYEKLGFVHEYELVRFDGVLPPGQPSPDVLRYAPTDLEEIITLDRLVSGADRRKLLEHLLRERGDEARVVREDGRLTGFSLSRLGAQALFIGPCLATTERAGTSLLTDAFGRHAGERVYVDIPLANGPAAALATAAGLTVQRHLLRMYRGVRVEDRPLQLWASSGPEKG